ncbi:MAG: hypothetical protein GXP62_18745 [Oligoflexia bacterium]|nr:hypothetical protein [Oligoflexia bacterium]
MRANHLALLGVVAAYACGSGSGLESDIGSYSESKWRGQTGPTTPGDYSRLDHAVVVPPDRAVMRIDIHVTEASADAAAKALRQETDRALGAATATCTTTWVDYSPPRRRGNKTWTAQSELRVDALLTEATDLLGRADRLDACISATDPILTWSKPRKLSDDGTVWVVRSTPLLVVDAPEAHADALLAKASQRLKRVSGGDGLHPEDLRCTPTGTITQGTARLSGVELLMELDCAIVRPESDDGPVLAQGPPQASAGD